MARSIVTVAAGLPLSRLILCTGKGDASITQLMSATSYTPTALCSTCLHCRLSFACRPVDGTHAVIVCANPADARSLLHTCGQTACKWRMQPFDQARHHCFVALEVMRSKLTEVKQSLFCPGCTQINACCQGLPKLFAINPLAHLRIYAALEVEY